MSPPFFFGAACRKRARELLGEEFDSEPILPGPVRPRVVAPPVRASARGADLVKRYQASQGPIAPRAPAGPPPKQRTAPPPAPALDNPEVKWLCLTDPSSPLLHDGYPPEAPIVEWSKELHATGVLSNVGAILSLLVGDAQVEIGHDAEWTEFPEVCDALRGLGCEEVSYCIAFCASKCRWAVGIGGKWKNREATAKLALAVLLAQESASLPDDPAFRQFCEAAGMPLSPGEEPEEPVLPQAGRRPDLRPARHTEERRVPQSLAPEAADVFPRDQPVWIALPPEHPVPSVLQGLPADTVVVATEGNRRKEVYSQADSILEMLSGDREAIKYMDDSNWDNFPLIGQQLKAVAEKEECMVVALCDVMGVWAVGVGMRRKNREMAAKVALATALALQAEDGGDQVDFSEAEALGEFVQEARQVRDDFTDAMEL